MVTVAYRPGLLFQSGAGEIWPRKPPPSLWGAIRQKAKICNIRSAGNLWNKIENLMKINTNVFNCGPGREKQAKILVTTIQIKMNDTRLSYAGMPPANP